MQNHEIGLKKMTLVLFCFSFASCTKGIRAVRAVQKEFRKVPFEYALQSHYLIAFGGIFLNFSVVTKTIIICKSDNPVSIA